MSIRGLIGGDVDRAVGRDDRHHIRGPHHKGSGRAVPPRSQPGPPVAHRGIRWRRGFQRPPAPAPPRAGGGSRVRPADGRVYRAAPARRTPSATPGGARRRAPGLRLRADVVRRKLLEIDEATAHLRSRLPVTVERLETHQQLRWAVERGLQVAAEALFDAGAHVRAVEFRDAVEEYRQIPILGRQVRGAVDDRARRGSIVTQASVAGLQAGYGPFAYSVAKGAVVHLSRVAAAALARHAIRVNAICPGLIPTSIFGRAIGESIADADRRARDTGEQARGFLPIRVAGSPDDIGYAVAYLASDLSRFVTGQFLAVDGGLTVGPRHAWDESAAIANWTSLASLPALRRLRLRAVRSVFL